MEVESVSHRVQEAAGVLLIRSATFSVINWAICTGALKVNSRIRWTWRNAVIVRAETKDLTRRREDVEVQRHKTVPGTCTGIIKRWGFEWNFFFYLVTPLEFYEQYTQLLANFVVDFTSKQTRWANETKFKRKKSVFRMSSIRDAFV